MTTKKDLEKVKEVIEEVNAQSNYFTKYAAIDCKGKIEKKNGLNYLSWAYAWAEFCKHCPSATYEVVKFDGLPYVFNEKTGYMVYTRVTAFDITREMWLPVMDSANFAMLDRPYEVQTKYKKITVQPATMFDINKAIMRCLTKNLAMFGLGLFIYAGEDLPEETAKAPEPTLQAATTPAIVAPAAPEIKAPAKPTTAKKPNPIRAELVELCKSNPDKIDFQAICKQYKLNNSAPDSSFEQALNYVKFCLRIDDAGLSEYPEEV